MLPSPLPWLRAHWRPVAIAAVVLLPFAAGVAVGRWSVRPPVIDLHQHDQVQTHATHHQVAAQQVQAQQVAAATVQKTEHKERHRHVHRVETIAPSGAKSIITDISDDATDDLQLASQVNVTFIFGSSLALSMDSTVAQTATRDLTLHEEPAPLPSWDAAAFAGLSTRGPIYAVQAGHRIVGPLWIRAQVQFGGEVAGIVGVGVSL